VLAEHRILFKITQTLLVLKIASRGGQSSLPRLHLFNWALKDSSRMAKLVRAAQCKRLDVLAWGFDPALAYALRYAVADGLITPVKENFVASDIGDKFIRETLNDNSCFQSAKTFLTSVGKSITEGMVETVSKGWEY
jgi:Na+(H+)/acetate symporter ActP